jgi:hypothetical protein
VAAPPEGEGSGFVSRVAYPVLLGTKRSVLRKVGWDLGPAFAEFEFCSKSTLIQLALILFINQIFVCVLTEITEIDNTQPIIVRLAWTR